MHLKPESLKSHLSGNALLPVYLISGDEPLLVQESADLLRAAAREQGYTEREIFNVEAHFDWDQLLTEANSLSLFSERKILEVRINNGKPGDKSSKALQAYCANPPADNLLIILCPKLDKKSGLSSKWGQAIDKTGAIIQVWPVSPAQLPQWIGRRLQAVGIKATPPALEILAARVQGNLLAATQEIEKLRLLAPEGTLDESTISAVVSDSARFNVFDLSDQALCGEASEACRTLRGLQEEGTQPSVILWLLLRDIRLLKQLTEAREEGVPLEAVLTRLRVWQSRKAILKRAAQTMSSARISWMLRIAAAVDRAIKGSREISPWEDLSDLVLMMSGRQPLRAESLRLSLKNL